MDRDAFKRKISRLFLPVNRFYWKMKWGPRVRKLIIGCGSNNDAGWLRTDIFLVPGGVVLDVTKEEDWERYFSNGSLTHILSEHMFEHFNDGDMDEALGLCWKYLVPGGRLRIAVPDANRTDQAYIEEVAPPADGHKQYFTAQSLESILRKAGFNVKLLEYYDSEGVFHKEPWDASDGLIRRSYDHDAQVSFRLNDHYYTSVIVDAFKPG